MNVKDRFIVALDFVSYHHSNRTEGENRDQVNRDSWCLEALKEQNIFHPITENQGTSEGEENDLSLESDIVGDYRYSPVHIFALDNPKMKSKSNEPLRAKFMNYGVVRLYKEYENNSKESKSEEIEVESDDTTVAIVAVPNYFSPTDLLVFLGSQVTNNVSHFRLIKSDNPNRFMVLMKFRNNEYARSFQSEFNGKNFNSMESEQCHVIFVKSVIFKPLNPTNLQAGIPYLLEDPFTLQVKKRERSNSLSELEAGRVVKELPTCPVCLERMDPETTGLLTISCQHTFHCNCLSKWKDDTCPVCRYSNLTANPLVSREGLDSCTVCGGQQNLWICLICGNIGCGRYNSKHAIQHYETTNHCFAMDISTQRVWDYAGDNYVHRLLQNETDGKLVELPGNSSTCSPSEEKDKSRDYAFEYTNVLLSQLESQREYYESRLAESAASFNKVFQQNKQTVSDFMLLREETKQVADMIEGMQAEVKKKSEQAEKKLAKVDQVKSLAQMFEKKWKEEQAITAGLSENLKKLQVDHEALKETNQDLQSQVTDLMFYLESQEKFKDASDEVKNGTVVLREGSSSGRRLRNHRS